MQAFTISRVVAFLTPVFAGLAGYVVTLATKLPGAPELEQGQLTALFVTGATVAGGAAVTWLNNRGKFERQDAAEVAENARQARIYFSGDDVEEHSVEDEAPDEVDLVKLAAGFNALAERLEEIEVRLPVPIRSGEAGAVAASEHARATRVVHHPI